MAVSKITLSSLTQRKARLILTVLAIALSVSLVIAVTSGYASAEAAVHHFFTEFMGSTDVKVRPEMGHAGNIKEEVLDDFRGDGDVQNVVGRLEGDTNIVDLSGKPIPGHEYQIASLIGVSLPDDLEVATLKMEPKTTGGWFTGDSGDVAVMKDGKLIDRFSTQKAGGSQELAMRYQESLRA